VSLQAVLWDMDGLLVDTEPLWTVAEHELAERLGGVFTPQMKAAIVGTRLDVAVPLFLQHLDLPVTPEAVQDAAAWLLARMVELFTRPLPLQPGAAELLAAVDAAGVPQALVSSSYRVLVDAVLGHGAGPFATTLAGDEVLRGKPHPEPYLTAAERLGVDPTQCVVLEDSPAGAASGEAAGCGVVAVPSGSGLGFSGGQRRLVVGHLHEVGVSALTLIVCRVVVDPEVLDAGKAADSAARSTIGIPAALVHVPDEAPSRHGTSRVPQNQSGATPGRCHGFDL
jgi:HAD superfamily hydrolase (TIGR01509 family)